MFAGVASRLQGHEICDCFHRNDTHVENHYYFNPRLGIRVTFAWRTGAHAMQFHNLSWIHEGCQARRLRAFREALAAGADFDNVSSAEVRRPVCTQTGCAPGACGDDYDQLLHGSDSLGVRFLVRALRPDALVMNAGLWIDGRFGAPDGGAGVIQRVVDIGLVLEAEFPNMLRVWKTTTWRAPDLEQNDQRIAARMLAGAGWRISDAGGASTHIRRLARNSGKPNSFYADKVHFQPWVYRGLNELLLADLCSRHVEW